LNEVLSHLRSCRYCQACLADPGHTKQCEQAYIFPQDLFFDRRYFIFPPDQSSGLLPIKR
jgi:hypothetical protein